MFPGYGHRGKIPGATAIQVHPYVVKVVKGELCYCSQGCCIAAAQCTRCWRVARLTLTDGRPALAQASAVVLKATYGSEGQALPFRRAPVC